ncbi:tetratricopeptide repeat protein, partial [Rhizobium sp. PDO1-076]|uniref:tetratricopeptide repeat protein n=1 Tax=Rhizobium sp. PDO1-076 TaxID=1125979 RepID=UPI001360B60A
MKEALDALGLADDDRIKLMRAGYSPKEILDLSDDEMDALFHSGFQALRVGDLEKARDMFATLCRLDALDARFPFALASTLQLQGRFDVAAKLYLLALGLDAELIDAYVRLGECLIQAQEYTEARDVLEVALALAGEEDV